MKQSVKLLKEYEERDRIRYATENAKNELEAYIYDTQDKLYDDLIISMSTEEERQKLSEALSAASVWLDENSESAKLDGFTSKKAELVSLGEGIFFRVRESTARMDALLLCVQTINVTRMSMENITQRNEVSEEEVQELFGVCDATEVWMMEKYAEQEVLELWKDPVLTSDQINTKCREVTRFASRLMRRPKRKPKKVEKIEVEEEKTKEQTDQETQSEEEAAETKKEL